MSAFTSVGEKNIPKAKHGENELQTVGAVTLISCREGQGYVHRTGKNSESITETKVWKQSEL